jgi:hypothetical protein
VVRRSFRKELRRIWLFQDLISFSSRENIIADFWKIGAVSAVSLRLKLGGTSIKSD